MYLPTKCNVSYYKNAPVTSSYTDDEILHMALGDATVENYDYYEDQVSEISAECVHIDDLIELCSKLIVGLEPKKYMSDLEILNLYTLRDKLKCEKTNLLKQLTLEEVYKHLQNNK